MKRLLLLLVVLLVGCYQQVELRVDMPSACYFSDKELLLQLHNGERQKAGVGYLKFDEALSLKAQTHAEWMAKSGKLQHSKLDPVGFHTMGENIAEGQHTEREVMKSWMNSPGHKRNILDRGYTRVGFGYAEGKNPFWCAVFGG